MSLFQVINDASHIEIEQGRPLWRSRVGLGEKDKRDPVEHNSGRENVLVKQSEHMAHPYSAD